jgi:hypothetical protein
LKIEAISDEKILKTFLSLERLDNSWYKRIKSLKKRKPLLKNIDKSLALYCEQFLTNSIYRHLFSADDTMWVRAITLSLIASWWIIQSIFEQERLKKQDECNLIFDIVRAYSAEVEYSENNLEKLFTSCYRFINV